MKNLFIQLSVANMLLLLIVAGWGHMRGGETDAGFETLVIITTVFTALVHSIVYTYFIAASKFVQSAVEDHGYPHVAAIDQSKTNKRKAFRYAFMAMMAVMIAAFLYFAGSPVRQDAAISRAWASIGVFFAILMNAYGIRKEWEYLKANLVLSDDILSVVTELRDQHPPVDPIAAPDKA